jgi:DNA-binding MarR family transcriptional regulator
MSDSSDRSALADRVHSAAIHLLRRLRKQDDASGLSAARMSALSVVVFGGPLTIGQLASAEQVSAPTMTRLVVGMQRDGLVKRERDAHDARIVWIRATAKGDRILREGRRRRVAALARELADLPAADAGLLERAAEIIERITRPSSAVAIDAQVKPLRRKQRR